MPDPLDSLRRLARLAPKAAVTLHLTSREGEERARLEVIGTLADVRDAAKALAAPRYDPSRGGQIVSGAFDGVPCVVHATDGKVASLFATDEKQVSG